MAFPVSDTFRKYLPESHQIAARIDICDPNSGEVLYVVSAIDDGQVTEDRTQQNRRVGTFTAIDETGTLTPDDADDLLTPFGNEYRPYLGMVFPDGSQELVPQGVLAISVNTTEDSGANFSMRVEGKDRSATVTRAGFQDTLAIFAGATVADAAQDILNFIGIDHDTDFGEGSDTVVARKVYNIGDDPWKALVALFTACGCDLFYDEIGVLVSAPLPDLGDPPIDWFVSDDAVYGNLLALERRLQRDPDANNWYVVTGEQNTNTGSIPRGEAFDNNPNSPTYVYGKYGIQMQHVADSTVTTDADATILAQHLLNEAVGLSEEVTSTILPNPAMQALDIVQCTRAKSKLNGINMMLDQVSHALVPTRASTSIARRLLI